MNKNQNYLKNLILIGIMILLCANNSLAAKFRISAPASDLEKLLIASYKKEATYQVPTPEEMQQAQNLFTKIFQSKSFDKIDIAHWQNLGFVIKKMKNRDIDYIVIKEREDIEPKGRGFYIIKTDNNSENILQAPHRPFDEHTHKIIFRLLTEGNYKAASWNSITRKIADLAKEPNSYFNAFTLAVANNFAQPKIFQLHGFDGPKHKTDSDMILSSSTVNPDATYANVAKCLRGAKNFKKFKILEFPKDIDELGGTRNINAKLFYQQRPNSYFFHIETSLQLRLALRDEKILRDQFSKCFIENSDKKSLQELK